MNIQPVKTPRINAYDDLYVILESVLPVVIPEKTIIVISSKIIALCEGSVVLKSKVLNKDELIIDNADAYLPRSYTPGGYVMHTIKNNLIIPTSGIDASNTGEYYALLPRDSYDSAKQIYKWVTENYGIQKCAIVISDSRSQILRNGVVGYATGFYGCHPIRNYRGTLDVFGHHMHFSQSNIPDAVSAAANLVMGEGNESTPIALVSDVPGIVFDQQDHQSDFEISQEEDMYFEPFFKNAPWVHKKTNQD